MMTREQAMRQFCPFTSFQQHCRAEKCPRWEDAEQCTGMDEYELYDQSYKKDCRAKHGISDCADCPEQYGFCR